jgi:thiamine pyrophosphokinase
MGRNVLLRSIVLLLLFAGCGGGEEDDALARAQQCERLRDHLVDLRLSTATNLGKELEQHRAALTQALGPQFIETCTKSTSEAQVACVLAAQDSQAATDCNAPTESN